MRSFNHKALKTPNHHNIYTVLQTDAGSVYIKTSKIISKNFKN